MPIFIEKTSGIIYYMVYVIKQKKEYTDRYDFHNKFHVHELYVDEFVDLLKTKFKNVNLYRQYLEVASFIDRADIDENVIQYHKNREKYNPEGKYVIAIAGNCELPQMSLSMASLHVREEYLSTLDELNYCRAEAIKCREKVSELDVLKNELKLANEELDRRMTELNVRQDAINALQHEVDEKNNQLKLANEELDRRMTELNIRQEKINELQHEIDINKNEIKLANEELDRRLIELEHRQDIINISNQEVADITNKYNHLKDENLQNIKTKEHLEHELEKTRNYKLYKLIELGEKIKSRKEK